MKKAFLTCVALCLCFPFLTGCARYYAVTDPGSGRSYYTDDIDDAGNGTISFKDARTGNEVILDSSEIKKITEEDYNKAVHGAAVP